MEDYRVEVRVTGRQAATYCVEVRGGQVQKATRNGQPLKQQRTMGTWSVPGMFHTIEKDLQNVELHASGRADQATPRPKLRCRFETKLGYPQQYYRIETSGRIYNAEVSWQVVSFEALKSRP